VRTDILQLYGALSLICLGLSWITAAVIIMMMMTIQGRIEEKLLFTNKVQIEILNIKLQRKNATRDVPSNGVEITHPCSFTPQGSTRPSGKRLPPWNRHSDDDNMHVVRC